MKAAKQPGSREQRRWLPWVAGLVLGVGAGVGAAWAYPPPSSDMLQVQAVTWYQAMRDLILPTTNGSTTGSSESEPEIYATAPIQLPPEPDETSDYIFDDAPVYIDVTAPLPDPDQLAARLDDAAAQLGLNHRMFVVDVATGQTLYDVGGDDSIVPASTLKLFTALSLLHQLDASHRFTTAATYDPGTGVSLVGGGDGLLSTAESTGETVGYAGLADLAEQTWEAIQSEVTTGQTIAVNVDVSRYHQPWVHPTWTQGLMAGGWVSPVYPLNTWGGFIADPQLTSAAVDDGAAQAGAAFSQHLTQTAQAAGYQVEFFYAGTGDATSEQQPVAEVHSAPLGEQLEFAMKQSNNMLFEMFGREAALAAGAAPDFTGSTQTTLATMQDLGIDTQDLQFVDNSGLSPDNRATLTATVDVYQTVMSQPPLHPVLDTLTVAGYDGTMRTRMTEAPYAGVVRSKTGTLEVASSNAGLTVTADGRAVWFAINTTGAAGDYTAARAEQDQLAEVLTDCGCTDSGARL